MSPPATGAPARARQRIHKDPPALAVPDINDNAAERKRVLNVLAQRRYRQRKRQNLVGKESSASSGSSTDLHAERRPEEAGPRPTLGQELRGADSTGPPESSSQPGADVEALGIWLDDGWMFESLASITETTVASPLPSGDLTCLGFDAVDWTPLSSHGMTPSSSEVDVEQDPRLCPDSSLLPVAELTLVGAFLRIADRLGCTSAIWDTKTLSPFNNPRSSSTAGALPETWRPTPMQTKVLHHPVLDLVPWPSARDRLIMIFELPESMRPASAAGPLGFVQFVYDLEDAAEGMRVFGGDPYDARNWEVGQTLFSKWWFVFDRSIVEQSNRWRSLRGAPRLRMDASPDRSGDA